MSNKENMIKFLDTRWQMLDDLDLCYMVTPRGRIVILKLNTDNEWDVVLYDSHGNQFRKEVFKHRWEAKDWSVSYIADMERRKRMHRDKGFNEYARSWWFDDGVWRLKTKKHSAEVFLHVDGFVGLVYDKKSNIINTVVEDMAADSMDTISDYLNDLEHKK